MGVVQGLCGQAILLSDGMLNIHGNTSKVIESYLKNGISDEQYTTSLKDHPNRKNKREAILQKADIYCDEVLSTKLVMGGNLRVNIYFKSETPINNFRIGISIEDYVGQRIVNFSPSHQNPTLINQPLSQGVITCNIPSLPLIAGQYYITFIIANAHYDIDRIDRAVQLTIESSDVFGTGQIPEKCHGIIYVHAFWELNANDKRNHTNSLSTSNK